jgi:hypothetical protein
MALQIIVRRFAGCGWASEWVRCVETTNMWGPHYVLQFLATARVHYFFIAKGHFFVKMKEISAIF